MTDHPIARGTSNNDLLSRLDRIEDKLDRRMNIQDDKLDDLKSRMDRLEGGISMLKWLGPTGVVAVIFGIAQSTGIIK